VKNRIDRVNEVIKRELSALIVRELSFQAKLVTVQQVDVTPDLKNAHVYIGVIGTPEEQRSAMAQLHDARQRLQHELSRRIILKFTPHLHFQLDQAGERGDRILQIIEELHLPPEPSAPPAPSAEDNAR
jgi:ribosome-binding factor A